MTEAGPDGDMRAPRRVTLRRSRAVRLASLCFALVCTAAVHFVATAHWSAVDAMGLAGAVLATLCLAFFRYERRQPAFIELTAQGVAAFDVKGRPLFQGRIVGFAGWAERLLFMAIGGPDMRRSHTLVVCADAVDAESFRVLAVRGRHAAY